MRPIFVAASLALGVALAATTSASALCVMCDSTVRLNGSLAECFAQRVSDVESKLTQSGKPFIIVDLSDCTSRDVLPTGPQPTGLTLDTHFIADAQSLKCLSAEIAATGDDNFDPSHVFDLGKACPAQ